jgi:hypothetical protein
MNFVYDCGRACLKRIQRSTEQSRRDVFSKTIRQVGLFSVFGCRLFWDARSAALKFDDCDVGASRKTWFGLMIPWIFLLLVGDVCVESDFELAEFVNVSLIGFRDNQMFHSLPVCTNAHYPIR